MTVEGGWPKGVKRTKQRELVYAVLAQAEAPLTAAALSALLEQAGTPVWLSTIYRVLDLFTAQGIVAKSDGVDGGMAMYEMDRQGHRHYAVCVSCRKTTPLQGCPLEHSSPQVANGEDFQITGHRLQIFGYCGDCRKGEKKG